MAYQLPSSQAVRLDPFTLKMMSDVLKEHEGVTDHESGYCCQVAAQYKIKVGAHNSLVSEDEKARKTDPESVSRPASEPQTRYINSLYRKCPEHLLSPVMREQVQMVVKHEPVTAEVASALIEALKSVVDGPVKVKEGEVRYATAPQIGFLRRLLSEREHTEKVDIAALETLPFKAASDMISRLKQAAYKGESDEAKAERRNPDEGVYQVGNDIYRVVLAVHGSGQPYASKFDPETQKFVYVGRKPFGRLTDETKMTASQASAFGELYGQCVKCSKLLTDDLSKNHGYGRKCASKMGWPYGE